MKYRFVMCSDVHSIRAPVNNPVYLKYAASGLPVFCCGDFQRNTSGLGAQPDADSGNYYVGRQMLEAYSKLGGLVIAGNHESVSNYGGVEIDGVVVDKKLSFTEITGYKGYEGNPYVSVKELHGDVFIGVSDSEGDCVYTQETQDLVLRLINETYAGRRIILMTHYALCLGSSYGDAFAARVGLDQTGNYKRQLSYPTSTAAAATRNGFFTQIAANHPNVLWFSGHCHNDWRMQEETVTVGSESDGPYPNIKAYRYPGGALMINLPSVLWRGQDAICEVYADKIVVKAREASASVRSLICADAMASQVGTNWDFEPLGEAYTYELVWDGEEDEPDEPDNPDDPTTPSGGVLSVPLRLTSGGTITRYEELPNWVRERLENGAKLWYMKDGVRHEVTWTEVEAEYEYNLDGGVLTIVRAPCRLEGGTLYIE